MLRIQHHNFFLVLIFLSDTFFSLNVIHLQLEGVLWYPLAVYFYMYKNSVYVCVCVWVIWTPKIGKFSTDI